MAVHHQTLPLCHIVIHPASGLLIIVLYTVTCLLMHQGYLYSVKAPTSLSFGSIIPFILDSLFFPPHGVPYATQLSSDLFLHPVLHHIT
ncbi:hypothetical protein WG66_002081 [Moniliophthora roreri]|nr:hypothetical protein WG66_002081 [Moniliophthora roreri]